MIVLSVAIVIAGAINLDTIRISEYRITVPKRSVNIDHLRVVFVADLHLKNNTSIGFIEKFVRKANNLHPDHMLFGGDMLEGDRENETSPSVEKAIGKIHSEHGMFAVTGNHEFYGDQQHFG